MASRFWVGGTGTWDLSSTTNWSATSGGASGASAPTTGDDVTFNGSSGGGVVTVASAVSGLSLVSLTAGAFTGTLDFAANGPINMTLTANGTAMNLSGTGTRKFLMGNGTFTFSGSTGTVTLWELGTATNLDALSSFSSCAIVYSGNTSGERQFSGSGQTYGSFTIGTNTSRGGVRIFGASTFSSISVATGTSYVTFPASSTTTITGSAGFSVTGSSSSQTLINNNNFTTGAATISLSSGASTPSWAAFWGITTTGAGTMTATNSFDLGRNTLDAGDTITAPTGGSSGGGIIGA